jgi:hypothetical protein
MGGHAAEAPYIRIISALSPKLLSELSHPMTIDNRKMLFKVDLDCVDLMRFVLKTTTHAYKLLSKTLQRETIRIEDIC